MNDRNLQERLVEVEERLQRLEDDDAIRRLICNWGPACDIGDREAAAASGPTTGCSCRTCRGWRGRPVSAPWSRATGSRT